MYPKEDNDYDRNRNNNDNSVDISSYNKKDTHIFNA